jgi:hypothetical protein
MKTSWWAVAAATFAAASVAAPQNAAPILQQNFETGPDGWTVFGEGAKVEIDKGQVRAGKPSLRYDFSVKKGAFSAALLPTGDGTLAKAKSLNFWLRCDADTTLILSLVEKNNGGRYNATFSVPANTWQQVQLSIDDFYPAEGKDDPKDPNGKLDLQDVEHIGIGDLGQFLAQIDNDMLAKLLNVKTGPRSIWLSAFTIATTENQPSFTITNGVARLDTMAHPQIGWSHVGSGTIKKVTEPPLNAPSLRVDYRQAPGTVMGIIRTIPRGRIAQLSKLQLDISSTKPATIIVQLEERNGGKYNATITLPGNSQLTAASIPFADFTQADDSRDTNGKLDLDEVHQITILDPSGLLGAADQDNTLWVANLRAVR